MSNQTITEIDARIAELIPSIGKYTYSKRDLFDRDITFAEGRLYDDTLKKDIPAIFIKDFFRYDPEMISGTCNELRYAAAQQLSKKYDGFIYYATGLEPSFFFSSDFKHNFLVLSNEELIKKDSRLVDMTGIKFKPLLENSVIHDPSFNRVLPFKESLYTVTKLKGMDFPSNLNTQLSLSTNKLVPLELTKDNIIIYLGYDNCSANKLELGIQKEKGCIPMYNIRAKYLNRVIEAVPEVGKYREYFMAQLRKNGF
jgi:hypothetical protein